MSTPRQRPTRSNSITDPQITLSSVKSLLDDHKKQILNQIKSETNSIKTLIKSLTDRIQHLESNLEVAITRVNTLEERLAQKEITNGETFEDMCYEAQLRHQKRKYLVISGLPEQSHGNLQQRREKDEQAIKDLADALDVEDFHPRDIMRIGRIDSSKPRLLRIKCQSVPERRMFLQRSKNLKSMSQFQNTYVNPDLTATQRKKSKQAREEVKRRREGGENVAIRNGRVVSLNDSSLDFQQRF